MTLSVTDLDLNLSNFEIEASRVRIGFLGLRCLEMESVNKQLANEANSKMQQFIEKYGSGDIELP